MQEYNRKHPFYASIKERYSLSKPGSGKETVHITLDLKGSGMTYAVGDSIAISPQNNPDLIRRTLEIINATGHEIVSDKRSGDQYKLSEFLSRKGSITEFSRKFATELAKKQTNLEKKGILEEVIEKSFKEYQANREVWDALAEHAEVRFEIQEFCDLLMPLLPRFYSIASSQAIVGEEMHLTVALLEYETNEKKRCGVTTNYLCNLAPLGEPILPIYVQPHHGFTLPEHPETPIIMVGPGTGIAPFRAFMQERSMHKNSKNWLFFGERNRQHNFFYEEYWGELQDQGLLRIHTAFSRDQEHKVYVQHLMQQHGKELYDWIAQGAIFYVCGDASRMAEDVDATLHRITQEHGNLSEDDAKAYIKKLRHDKRYLKDVY